MVLISTTDIRALMETSSSLFICFSVEALRAAVAAHESIETIQELFEGGRVPKDVRAEFWKVRGKNGHTFIFNVISYEAYILAHLLRLQDELS